MQVKCCCPYSCYVASYSKLHLEGCPRWEMASTDVALGAEEGPKCIGESEICLFLPFYLTMESICASFFSTQLMPTSSLATNSPSLPVYLLPICSEREIVGLGKLLQNLPTPELVEELKSLDDGLIMLLFHLPHCSLVPPTLLCTVPNAHRPN